MNGKAERAIRTIMAMARTQMLHCAVAWPAVADPTLWPLAVKHSVWLHNRIPNPSTGLSPIDVWTKQRFPLRKFHDAHVFGAPVFVLQKRLADGKSIGRWQPRSTRCMCLGFSDKHATTVPLILNLSTGSITPQFNITVDNWFSTAATSDEDLPAFNADEWASMFGTHTCHFPDEPSTASEEHLLRPPTPTRSQLHVDSNWPDPQFIDPTPPPLPDHTLLEPSSSSSHDSPVPFKEENDPAELCPAEPVGKPQSPL